MRYWCIEMARVMLVIFFLLLTSCDQIAGEAPMNTIAVKIGESGENFLRRNKLTGRANVDKQPAGLNFYEYGWPTKMPGKILVEHGSHGFEIPFVLGVTGTEDTESLENGITDFQIRAGITAADTVLHEEARQEFIKLLKKLDSLGWKPFIFYQQPRLSGEYAFRFSQGDGVYGLPLDYYPSLEEWMLIDVGRWYLYADGVFLKINFRRDRKLMTPTMPGAYLVTFDFQTVVEHAKSEFEGDDRNHWKELWVNKIKSLKKERYEKETELTRRGFTIYTEYEEPKIHPADPVEP